MRPSIRAWMPWASDGWRRFTSSLIVIVVGRLLIYGALW